MKVRVSYTIEVDDDFRRAINQYHGDPGKASREIVKMWFIQYGQTMNDDLMESIEEDEDD